MKETEYKLHYNNLDKLKEEIGVYLIRNLDNNKLKIGITNNLVRRFKEITKSFNFCGTSPKLKIECYIEYKNNEILEQFLHNELKDFNYQNEWFSIDDINIVLDKLKDFEYKEIIEQKFQYNPPERKIKKKVYKNYSYYKYETFEDAEILNIYMRFKGNEYDATYYINKLNSQITGYQNHFNVDEDYYGDIINPKKHNSNYDIVKLFDSFNTDSIIEYLPDKFMSLELYILNKHKEKIIKTFEYSKNIIISKLNNSSFDCNNTIEDIQISLNNIESLCIDIQKQLNECIVFKNRQDYKQQGYRYNYS